MKIYCFILIVIFTSSVTAQLKNEPFENQTKTFIQNLNKVSPDVTPSVLEINEQAVKLYLDKKYDESIERFRQAQRLAPKITIIKVNLGIALVKAQRYEEARDYCRQSIKEGSGEDDAHLYAVLASALYESGDYKESIIAYQKAIETDNQNAVLINDLGIALYNNKEISAALEAFQNSLRIKPDAPDTLNNYGVALVAAKKYHEAIDVFKRSIDLQPVARTQNNLGTVYFYLGKKKEARSNYLECLRLDPQWSDAQYNLGLMSLKDGKRNIAREYLNMLQKQNSKLAENLQKQFYKDYIVEVPKIN